MSITTAMCTSFKRDLFSGLHCFNATVTPTGDTTNGSAVIANVSSLTGLAVGMSVSGTGIASGSVIASIDSGTQITLSKAATATNTGVTLTVSGDSLKVALFKSSVSGTYGAGTSNYSDMTGNSDETSGTGYTSGGMALTNVSPATSGTTAYVDFADVSWTSASFSTSGAMIYNTSRRGPTANQSTSVHDFGGTQTVTSGTFTLVFPTPDASNAILRLA